MAVGTRLVRYCRLSWRTDALVVGAQRSEPARSRAAITRQSRGRSAGRRLASSLHPRSIDQPTAPRSFPSAPTLSTCPIEVLPRATCRCRTPCCKHFTVASSTSTVFFGHVSGQMEFTGWTVRWNLRDGQMDSPRNPSLTFRYSPGPPTTPPLVNSYVWCHWNP